MLLPVQCWTCGKCIGGKWDKYQSLLSSGMEESKALDELQLKRYCCRRMLLGHVPLIDKMLVYHMSPFILNLSGQSQQQQQQQVHVQRPVQGAEGKEAKEQDRMQD